MMDYPTFRRELDEVLRRRDPAALRAFLIEQGQWAPDAAMDPATAMWMMIAASPNLTALHDEACAWLVAHGRESEADAISRKHAKAAPPKRTQPGQ